MCAQNRGPLFRFPFVKDRLAYRTWQLAPVLLLKVFYGAALASSSQSPTLLLVFGKPEMPMLLKGDSRITTHDLTGSAWTATE